MYTRIYKYSESDFIDFSSTTMNMAIHYFTKLLDLIKDKYKRELAKWVYTKPKKRIVVSVGIDISQFILNIRLGISIGSTKCCTK